MAEGKMSEELIEKKLMSFNNSQDSVQALSLWVMHNKSHHQKIVDTWLKVLRKSEVKHKLTLFYLCNDVVQHAKKKKALYYLENFKDNLREAVYVVREYDSIKPNIGRVFKIWEERKTYDPKFVKELRGILDGAGSSSKSSSARSTPAQVSPASYKPSNKEKHKHKHKAEKEKGKGKEAEPKDQEPAEPQAEEITNVPVGEFKPPSFLDEMSKLKKLEGEVTTKAKQLASLRIDATNIEAVKQLKDRSHGNEFCRQFEESCVKIEDYVAMLGREIKQRKIVLAHSESAEEFYSEQFKEASIVANAYKNFGARVSNMKKRVDDMKKIIPSTPSPVPSPTADAPSPGNSPSMLNMDDNETVDMDLCNDDADAGKQDPGSNMPGRAYTAMVKSISQPIASLTDIVMGSKDTKVVEEKEDSPVIEGVPPPTETFQGTNILESRIATMLPNLARGSSSMGQSSQPPSTFTAQPAVPTASVPEVYSPSQPEPADMDDDGGSSTPVMDEPEEKSPSPPKVADVPVSKTADSKTKTTPIDFLSQLLTKSSSSSSSSNFLQTLSLLTNTVKTQYQKQANLQANDGGVSHEKQNTTSPTSVAPSTELTPPPVTEGSDGNWSGWKPVPPAQPPLPAQDPSSPPILGQVKPEPPPPLPQHPPQPPEPLPLQPFPVPPPGQQDYSLPPPPSVGQPVSQPYIPPPVPSSTPFPPRPETSTSTFPSVSSSAQAPPALTSPRPNLGFNQTYRFPAAATSPANPPLPTGQPPIGVPPPGFIAPRPENPWEQPRVPITPGGVPPPTPPTPSYQKPFAPPPPPPDNTSHWAQPPPQQPPPSQTEGFSRISSIPSQRGDWRSEGRDYDRKNSWNSSGETRETGYAHPWDQPQNYDEDEEDSEYADQEPVTSLPPPPKSILRNNRTSSLREVTLVDESNSGAFNQDNVQRQSIPEAQPSGILKKPLVDSISNVTNPAQTDEQSEFINILKQKSGTNLPSAPPSSRILTSIMPVEPAVSDFSHHSEIPDIVKQGNGINTIGVLGRNNRTSSVKSDDMDIDNDDQESYGNQDSYSGNEQAEEHNSWESDASHWKEKDREHSDQHWDNRNRDFHRQNSDPDRNFDFHRQNSDPDRNFKPRWPDYNSPRHPPSHPRGGYGHEHFRPRNFPSRPPRFSDSYHGPSPSKRPYFPPRPRMPYFRY